VSQHAVRQEVSELVLDDLGEMCSRLTAHGLADPGVFERIRTDVKAEIDGGVQYALAAPYPEANEVDQDVYA
jgi:TPP-dependent pyruvate/acetoin dehydrogenase alpha subunit